MSNFTVAIPDDLLADAKIAAAKAGTSVNSVIRTLLEGFVRNESGPLTGNFEIIFRYSIGKLTAAKAVQELHLDTDEQLRAMTLQSGLPLPRLSINETDGMEKHFGTMVERFGRKASA